MNKNDLISAVAEAADLSKADSEKAVTAVFDAIASAIARDDVVRIVGFGVFRVTQRAASVGRNPRTGEPIELPPSRTPKFTASKTLKAAVN